jgi:16S rRNA (cytidine1402-2'-O)-methyltransferase
MTAQAKQEGGHGTLYVVSTPIGNLEDVTLRALEVLKGVDLIAAEGVKHFRVLCRHYGIERKVVRYNQHNHRVRGPELIRRLKSGSDIALVTNAGTPCVSDPGVPLVQQALDADIRVSPIPGPSALTAALAASGMRADRFVFIGFLSARAARRRKELGEVSADSRTLVFYEAPHRLEAMLADALDILGDRRVVLMRELTKIYEEVSPGTVGALLGRVRGKRPKGEVVLVVAGREEEPGQRQLDEDVKKRIISLMRDDALSVRDVAERLAQEEGVSYRRMYKACLAEKKRMVT